MKDGGWMMDDGAMEEFEIGGMWHYRMDWT